MVKSEGFFVPTPPLFMTLVITLKNVNEPGKGGHFPFMGLNHQDKVLELDIFPSLGLNHQDKVLSGHFPHWV